MRKSQHIITKGQFTVFNEFIQEDWEKEWVGMPEYYNVEKEPPAVTTTFKFRNQEDFELFNQLLKKCVYNGKKVFDGMQRKTVKSSWFPSLIKASRFVYKSETAKTPQFPVYIISKGRWERRQTSKTLESMNVPYRIVVEPSEYKNYASVIDKKKILVLPSDFSKLGQGSIPVRNWVWEHSIKEGHEWHWILDDNIESVERFNNNMKIKCNTSTPFYIIEEFVLRYKNIAQAGMNYALFCPATEARPPIRFNTRIYSCILIRNDLPFRWRGKYNEDTDLSIRVLKDGWCTVLFNAFLIGKRATMTQNGGNTNTIYNEGDERLKFAESLQQQHPDVVKIVRRFNRWHHYVNYKLFKKNKLIKKQGINIINKTNNYGMKLIDKVPEKKVAG